MFIYYPTLRQVMRPVKGVKKLLNVSLAPEIPDEARSHNINLSAVLTEALQETFRDNQRVDENGSFSDFQRSF